MSKHVKRSPANMVVHKIQAFVAKKRGEKILQSQSGGSEFGWWKYQTYGEEDVEHNEDSDSFHAGEQLMSWSFEESIRFVQKRVETGRHVGTFSSVLGATSIH